MLLRCRRRRVKDALRSKIENGSQHLDKLPCLEGPYTSLCESRPTICEERTTTPADPSLITESVADLINRKARTLVLLFPLSYTVLVIVSFSKLVYDTTSSKPSVALHAIALWTMFLQGTLDALTYGWAGTRLKQTVRNLEEQQPGSQ
ncbi:hypothetical protein OPQ81_001326 [Rhizoctonia solani]|nr:hypothetical protein OPQ81_001326 [Rhizoctonia solani]